MSELAEKIRLTRDEAIFDLLLDEHTEAAETMHRGVTLGIKGGKQNWGLDKPATWTDDHKWLSRLLLDYHDYCKRVAIVQAKVRARQSGSCWAAVDFRNGYWHLAQWYFVCKRTNEPIWILDKKGSPRRNKEGQKIQKVAHGQLQWERRVVRGTTDHARVKAGLAWLEKAWEGKVRPSLGREPRYVEWEKLLEPRAA